MTSPASPDWAKRSAHLLRSSSVSFPRTSTSRARAFSRPATLDGPQPGLSAPSVDFEEHAGRARADVGRSKLIPEQRAPPNIRPGAAPGPAFDLARPDVRAVDRPLRMQHRRARRALLRNSSPAWTWSPRRRGHTSNCASVRPRAADARRRRAAPRGRGRGDAPPRRRRVDRRGAAGRRRAVRGAGRGAQPPAAYYISPSSTTNAAGRRRPPTGASRPRPSRGRRRRRSGAPRRRGPSRAPPRGALLRRCRPAGRRRRQRRGGVDGAAVDERPARAPSSRARSCGALGAQPMRSRGDRSSSCRTGRSMRRSMRRSRNKSQLGLLRIQGSPIYRYRTSNNAPREI